MLNIVVTADTHLPSKTRELPAELLQACETADLIIHAGDWRELSVYEELAAYAKVVGVHGNVDSPEVKDRFPKSEMVEAGGFRIGITHGHGEKKTTEKRALDAFAGEQVDVIIFGHSHIPLIRYAGDIMLMNPGSPTYKRKLPFYSFGILEIEKCIRASIIYFE